MSKINYDTMSDQELRQYFLEHKKDMPLEQQEEIFMAKITKNDAH